MQRLLTSRPSSTSGPVYVSYGLHSNHKYGKTSNDFSGDDPGKNASGHCCVVWCGDDSGAVKSCGWGVGF